MGKIDRARDALSSAETKVTEAENARDECRWALDNELALAGWHHAGALYSPGGVPRYENVAYPSARLTVEEVQQLIEQQRAALA